MNEDEARALLQDKLRELLEAQPWWKRSSNTVTSAVGGLVAFAWWLSATGADLPTEVTYAIAAVIFIGGVLGVKQTKNGITPSVVTKVVSQLASPIAEHGDATQK